MHFLTITFGVGRVHFLAIPSKVSCGIFISLRHFNSKFGFLAMGNFLLVLESRAVKNLPSPGFEGY